VVDGPVSVRGWPPGTFQRRTAHDGQMRAGRDRAFVATMAALVAVRAAVVGGVALMFLWVAGAIPVGWLLLALVPVVVFGALMAVGYVRLSRQPARRGRS